jgi:type 1 glutamine amidotransferase
MRFLQLSILLGALLPFASDLSAAEPVANSVAASQLSNGDAPDQSKSKTERPKLALVVSEFEYLTYDSLPEFAEDNLENDFEISSAINSDEQCHELPGIGILRDADVAIFSIWRRTLPPEQLNVVKEYIAAGKPIVALRTTAHAFQTRDGTTPDGRETWPTFDRDVLGGYYQGHHGNYVKQGLPPTHVWVLPEAQDNPLVAGISSGEFTVPSWLYKMQPLKDGAQPLMMGRVADRQPHEPVAWTYQTQHGGRVFYTSLGSPEDFEQAEFQHLLRNAVYWAAGESASSSSSE